MPDARHFLLTTGRKHVGIKPDRIPEHITEDLLEAVTYILETTIQYKKERLARL